MHCVHVKEVAHDSFKTIQQRTPLLQVFIVGGRSKARLGGSGGRSKARRDGRVNKKNVNKVKKKHVPIIDNNINEIKEYQANQEIRHSFSRQSSQYNVLI